MTLRSKQLAAEALCLSPKERAALADTLLVSLDHPDPKIDALWKTEAERRLLAYRKGTMRSVTLDRVLGKYRKKKAA